MGEHLSLETCRRLKEAGYPQIGEYLWANDSDGIMKCVSSFVISDYWGHSPVERFVAPQIITADGKGGVLPWLESKGIQWVRAALPCESWSAFDTNRSEMVIENAATPEALIIAVLDERAQHPAPDAPQAVRE